MRRLTFFFVMAIIFLGAASAFGAVVNRIVAVVNNDVISLHDLEKQSRRALARLRSTQDFSTKEKIYEAEREVLESMIDKLLAEKETTRLGIVVTDEEVNRGLERIKRDHALTQEELVEQLSQQDLSMDDLREQVKDELRRHKLLDKEVRARIVISDKQIRQYYGEHKDEFVGKSRIWLKTIVISVEKTDSPEAAKSKREQALNLVEQLRKGANFEEMARKYSQGPNAAGGGDLGYLDANDLAPYIKETVLKMKPGDVTDAIESPYGYQIVTMVQKEGEGVKSYEEVRDSIQEELYRAQINEKYQSWLKGLRDKAYIKITF